MMRWIVVFNPILVLFLMAVHKLSGDEPIDQQNQLHIQQQHEQHRIQMSQNVNLSGINRT
jgi:hypothetical protein